LNIEPASPSDHNQSCQALHAEIPRIVTGFESPDGIGIHRQALHPETQQYMQKWMSRQAVSRKFPEFNRILEQIQIMHNLRMIFTQFIPNNKLT